MKKRTAKRILIICLVIAAAAALTAGIVMDSMRVDVCLDPGHGGDDSGAQYEGRLEKDDNLESYAEAIADGIAKTLNEI